MSLRALASACLGVMTAVALPATADPIDFEDIATGTVLPSGTNFGGITFLSTDSLLVTDLGTGNALCGVVNGACGGGIGLEFDAGARFLSLTVSGDTDPTTQYIFEGVGSILFEGEQVPFQLIGIIFADGDPFNEQVQAFSSPFLTLDSFSISSLDGSAFVIDNIDFEAGAAAVPEPAAWALMIGGFGLVGGSLRRRRTTVRFA